MRVLILCSRISRIASSDRLLREDHEVIAWINSSLEDQENLAHHPESHFSFIRHDVPKFIFVPGKIDAVLHFASPATQRTSPYGYVIYHPDDEAGALGTTTPWISPCKQRVSY